MKSLTYALKIVGIVLLSILALRMGVYLLIDGVVLAGVFARGDAENMGYMIGRFIGSLFIPVVIVWGIIKLAKSLKPSTDVEDVIISRRADRGEDGMSPHA